jgi:hypothetical protein
MNNPLKTVRAKTSIFVESQKLAAASRRGEKIVSRKDRKTGEYISVVATNDEK